MSEINPIQEETADAPFSLAYEPLPERRGRPAIKADPESTRYNEALWRIVKDEAGDVGGVVHELAVITGLTQSQIHARVNGVEYDPGRIDPSELEYTTDDLRYFGRRYASSKDPVIRSWWQNINGGQRKHPDREDPRVKRERAGGKLISVAIDPLRN